MSKDEEGDIKRSIQVAPRIDYLTWNEEAVKLGLQKSSRSTNVRCIHPKLETVIVLMTK